MKDAGKKNKIGFIVLIIFNIVLVCLLVLSIIKIATFDNKVHEVIKYKVVEKKIDGNKNNSNEDINKKEAQDIDVTRGKRSEFIDYYLSSEPCKKIKVNNSGTYKATDFDINFNVDKTNKRVDFIIDFDGKTIDSTKLNQVYDGTFNTFVLYNIDGVYILEEFVGRQCFQNSVIIFNADGEILKQFDYAYTLIFDNRIEVLADTDDSTPLDGGKCLIFEDNNMEDHIYFVEGNQLIEK